VGGKFYFIKPWPSIVKKMGHNFIMGKAFFFSSVMFVRPFQSNKFQNHLGCEMRDDNPEPQDLESHGKSTTN
jgi:hypothetical protein